MSEIHVFHPIHERYIPVPALNQEYTRGLTLHQHKIIQKYARHSLNERLDAAALCEARKRIEEIVAKELVTHRTLRGRQQAARFSNLGQPDYTENKKKDGGAPAVVSKAKEDAPTQTHSQELAPEIEDIFDPTGWSATYNLRDGEDLTNER